VLSAIVLAIPIAGWVVAAPRLADAQARQREDFTHHVLTFVADGAGGVTYEGQPVDRDAITDLCRRAAAADPRTEVLVKTPKALDRAAMGAVAFGAASAGLGFSALPAQ